eukprot:1473151-Lingulodinium_polyedra.AAC.1
MRSSVANADMGWACSGRSRMPPAVTQRSAAAGIQAMLARAARAAVVGPRTRPGQRRARCH